MNFIKSFLQLLKLFFFYLFIIMSYNVISIFQGLEKEKRKKKTCHNERTLISDIDDSFLKHFI